MQSTELHCQQHLAVEGLCSCPPASLPAVAGLLGVQQQLRLPAPVALDPGTLTDAQRQAAGIAALPTSLGQAIEAFEQDAGKWRPLWQQQGNREREIDGGGYVAPAAAHRQTAGLGHCLLHPSPALPARSANAPPAHLPCPPASAMPAEFRAALDTAFGTDTLARAFLGVRRSEWAHFGGQPLEAEAAALFARY